MLDNLKKYNIILASKSPRRQELLKGLNIDFTIQTKEVEEIFPDNLVKEQIPLYLAELKATAFENDLSDADLLITSDTIVWSNNQQLGKPKDRIEAIKMLQSLSNKQHEVITGVCLKNKAKTVSFTASTKVVFKELSNDEIEFYVDTYKPFDKAGSYGIQEWIGYIGIQKIEGTYFNVMGLPLFELNQHLKNF